MRRQKPKTITKRATNVSIRSDLLAAAKRKRWRKENREAITAYNEHVEKHGVFSDDTRSF